MITGLADVAWMPVIAVTAGCLLVAGVLMVVKKKTAK